jgi:hypothetical protein
VNVHQACCKDLVFYSLELCFVGGADLETFNTLDKNIFKRQLCQYLAP